MRVGDLAAASGLTVRAIHHYEAIGLIPPAPRSTGGHRLYDLAAVERLYRIGVLRRLGLSLHEIGIALDQPGSTLARVLERHGEGIEAETARLVALRGQLAGVLVDLEDDREPTANLLEVLKKMELQEMKMQRRISILVCRDPAAAHAWLAEVFGLTPGEVSYDGDGHAVHAELYAGDGVVWLHPETEAFGLASPRTLGSASATMAVMVDDVDEHHRQVVAHGGEIVYGPVDQPYGYREYSARDCEGTLWSFMRALDA